MLIYCDNCISLFRNVSQLHDEWFADEERVRRSVGLLSKSVILFPNDSEVSSSPETLCHKFCMCLLVMFSYQLRPFRNV